mmetsp:Transcript_61408/g.162737  ORF Transcript_61408/g.162737 Transcript_61408/m.162737 type:complete len:90 (-) Transcript_61408:266-535(-)
MGAARATTRVGRAEWLSRRDVGWFGCVLISLLPGPARMGPAPATQYFNLNMTAVHFHLSRLWGSVPGSVRLLCACGSDGAPMGMGMIFG